MASVIPLPHAPPQWTAVLHPATKRRPASVDTMPRKIAPASQATLPETRGRAAEYQRAVAADLRDMRANTNQPLARITEYLGHGRDWLSKIERGLIPVSVHEYVLLCEALREGNEGHPALALASRIAAAVSRTDRARKRADRLAAVEAERAARETSRKK